MLMCSGHGVGVVDAAGLDRGGAAQVREWVISRCFSRSVVADKSDVLVKGQFKPLRDSVNSGESKLPNDLPFTEVNLMPPLQPPSSSGNGSPPSLTSTRAKSASSVQSTVRPIPFLPERPVLIPNSALAMLAYRRFPFHPVVRPQIIPRLPRAICRPLQFGYGAGEGGRRFRGRLLWASERGCGGVAGDGEVGRRAEGCQKERGGGDPEVSLWMFVRGLAHHGFGQRVGEGRGGEVASRGMGYRHVCQYRGGAAWVMHLSVVLP